jgi:hypothetical protein
VDELLAAVKGVAPSIAAAALLVGGLGRGWVSLAVALGLGGAHVALKGWPGLPGAGADGVAWIIWSVAAAALLATAEQLGALRRPAAPMLGLLLLAVQPWLVLALLCERWPALTCTAHVALPAVAAVFAAIALRRVAERRPGLTVPLVWICAFAVDAIVLLQARSALLAQLAGAVAAALGTACCTALWRRGFTLAAAHVVPLVAAHAGLLLAGYHFTYEASAWATLAAALAPLGLALGHPRSARRQRLAVAASAAAMALALAVALLGGGEGY